MMTMFLFGMLVMYLVSGFCWMKEDFFAPSEGWYTPLPDILYRPIKIFLGIIGLVIFCLKHPIIVIKFYLNKIKGEK